MLHCEVCCMVKIMFSVGEVMQSDELYGFSNIEYCQSDAE